MERSTDRRPWTDAELHARRAHPEFEYRDVTVETGVSDPPDGAGWKENLHAFGTGSNRRRLGPDAVLEAWMRRAAPVQAGPGDEEIRGVLERAISSLSLRAPRDRSPGGAP